MAKKRKSSALTVAVVPTGLTSDGTKYFREKDLMTGDGSSLSQVASISLKLLPPGDIPPMLDPAHESSRKSAVYEGKLVPLFCSKDAGSGTVILRCKHVITRDEKTGKATKVCCEQWALNRAFNIGPFREHVKNRHWRKTAPGISVSTTSGVNPCRHFLPPNQKARSANQKLM